MTVDFAQPHPDHPTAPSNKSRNRGILIGFGAASAVAVAVGGGYAWFNHNAAQKPFALSGTLTLSTTSATTGDGCHGTGGYHDITPGASISVSDESGTLLAKGTLSSGHGESGSCYMPFSIDDVPGGKKFYKVEVTHRGEVNYTEAEAKKGISLQLGESSDSPSTPTRTSTPTYTPTPTPRPSASSPGGITLAPDGSGRVYIQTRSGKTRCQITASEIGCQAPFTNAPYVNGGRANGIRFGADGSRQWVNGDLGNIPVTTIGYDIYQAVGWTIAATYDGTSFMNQRTGHSVFVSIDRVDTN
ncbi:lipoprotein LpqJ [Mycobacteroides abscessus subsp. abscessus]|nr:lipoprotein LpqJ [Mycobacteroides abscessus subsp. abscessus]